MNTFEVAPSISFRGEPNSRNFHPRRTATSVSMVSPRLTQEGRIRSRLFHRLGIDPEVSKRRNLKKPQQQHKRQQYSNIRTKTVSEPFFQPLRGSLSSLPDGDDATPPLPAFSNMVFAPFWSGYKSHPRRQPNSTGASSDSGGEEDAPVESTSAAATSSSSSARTVRFDRDVLVVPIPSRHAYSDRIQKAFWRKGNELQETVDRNRYEFTVEGWDWNTVLEDDEMYIDVATGEKIHPCWVEGSDEGQMEG